MVRATPSGSPAMVGHDEILVALGDTIRVPTGQEIDAPNPCWELSVWTIHRNFLGGGDRKYRFISRVVEKPAIPKSNMALVGV